MINSNLLRAVLFLMIAFMRPLPGVTLAQVEIPSAYQLAAENDLFRLYVDSSTLAFKLLDKRSNYLWHSGIDELLEEDRLNKSWQAFAQSGVSIEYLDEKAINKRVSLTNTNHTLEITPVEQGVRGKVTFQDYGITFNMTLQLELEGVRVEVPFDSIHEEDPKFRLGRIYPYPFLGATRGSTVPGYMFIPDGTGSLIEFADSTKAQEMFYGRYYGPDLGMIAFMPYDFRVTNPYPISFPVYGMAHEEGKNAFVSIVEKGAAYGELQVHPAGIITNFNFLYSTFIYNETYFQATNRSGAGVTMIQKQPNHFDAVIHFRFLTGADADYVGMARSYQQYLVENGLLHRHDITNPNIGIRLEFLGGDKEKVLFWNRFVPMTTLNQVNEILSALQLPNNEVIYYGWQPFGATSMPPDSLILEASLGSVEELRAIADKVVDEGGRFSLYLNPQVALWDEAGYSSRNDLAMAVTNVNLEGYNRWFPNYYFTLDALQYRYSALTNDIASQLGGGLALDSIGSILYSDFRDSTPFSRESAIEAYQTLLSASSLPLNFYRPNDYFFGLAQAYYDMPLGDNGYVYTSKAVPFLPIVLAGHMPYYGTAINFSSNLQEDLLRHVEFGIYPSYFLTHEATANLLNTPSGWIYTSSYAQWGEQVRNTYEWMNALLAPVRGQEIIAHKELAEGIFVTTYANGHQIIVNYTDHPFTHNGLTIEAKNALFVENGR